MFLKISKNSKDQLNYLLNKLISQCIVAGTLETKDRVYGFNRLISRMGLADCGSVLDIYDNDYEIDLPSTNESVVHSAEFSDMAFTIGATINRIIETAVELKIIADVFDLREVLAADLLDCLMGRPSDINNEFYHRYSKSPQEATDWFYTYCQNVQYIQAARITKNVSYKAECDFGLLDITINLSKPEKNPKDIAAERHAISSGYPKCLLCRENEGFSGRVGHPARANHRLISLPDLVNEEWYLQYSPYSYYPEHCIVLSTEHRPMKIDRQTFARIISFLDRFPHYFIGSNADLPIVGGSILSHDHYQGGRYSFAMDRAGLERTFKLSSWPDISAGIVHWPMSVIRLAGNDSERIIDCAASILEHWREYSDPEADILAVSDGEPHNTITPIGRMRDGRYELDLVLRNNRCTSEHPMGIFHPHADVHHIKQENIGLIEVMGLAVLPARLVKELDQAAAALINESEVVDEKHQVWISELRVKYPNVLDLNNAEEIIRRETARKFERVLEDAGLFKHDAAGREALVRYIEAVSIL
ncbi:MAG: UDP-glucose--hexose-1-phosphate uridylyltransferase [Eubacteriales bacterium]|nr:UDP-glucose--hexose-1-phosphate uridylyltransferase [Eubacteriales bacterium]MDD3197927.1 UDP-glucose--hexose-1-phosphate uridylyltransferase [Eubacteriales bacterium]MDD4682891.1 UDP-glucose--hexose-1-phosphate uridylyltransferase [Eubacteriales bacterium]